MVDGWYSRILSDGRIVSGAGLVWLDGKVIGSGIKPEPLSDDEFVVMHQDSTLHTLFDDGQTAPLTEPKAMHSASGGVVSYTPPGIWVHVGHNGKVVRVMEDEDDWSIRLDDVLQLATARPVNFARQQADHVVFTMFEPTEVWGFAPHQASIKLGEGLEGLPVGTPQGMWVLIKRHTDLVLVPWGSVTGYVIPTGDNNNQNPDARWVDGRLIVVCNNNQGERVGPFMFTLGEPRVNVVASGGPAPSPLPPPVEPDVTQKQREASVLAVAKHVNEQFPHLLKGNTKEEAGTFTELVVGILHDDDPKWGHVGKSGGQTQYKGHAIDACMYNGPVEVYDFITNAGDGPGLAKPTAILKESGGQPWVDPDDIDPPDTEPVPAPVDKPCEFCEELGEEIDTINESLNTLGLDIEQIKQLVSTHNTLIATLIELTAKPVVVKGSTSRAWGHSHDINIEVG